MTRREIFAIIVIVNVVLLALLFTTAHRLEEGAAELPLANTEAEKPHPPPAKLSAERPPIVETVMRDVPIDEIDEVLRDFAAVAAAAPPRRPPSPPPAVVTPTVAADPELSSTDAVTVRRGDTLEKLARHHGISIEALKQANQLTGDQLKVGQLLHLPKRRKAEASTPTATIEGQLYRVKAGDNPWKIAKQCHVSVEDLLRLNDLNEDSARNLKPGEMIRVQ